MPKLIPNGVYEVKPDEYQSFPVRVRGYGRMLVLFVYKDIREALSLKSGDLVEVAIRKITEQECKSSYGFIPELKKKQSRRPRIKCPRCGKPGYLAVVKGYPCVRHNPCDGYPYSVAHSITRGVKKRTGARP